MEAMYTCIWLVVFQEIIKSSQGEEQLGILQMYRVIY